MDRKDIRGMFVNQAPTTNTLSGVLRRVGKALGTNQSDRASAPAFEQLENRQLLDGSFASPVVLGAPDADGRITQAASITPATPSTDNDFFRFTAPTNDYITVLADTSNEAGGSNLNTRLQIFNAAQQLVAQSTNNGTLTSGFQRDAWVGFVPVAGQQYFAVVSSEGAQAGTYTLRVDVANAQFRVGPTEDPVTGIGRAIVDETPPNPIGPFRILGQLGGTNPVIANRLRQDDIVYRFDVPATQNFDSLVTVSAQTTQNNLTRRIDTRTEVYDSTGTLVTFDSDSGTLNDSYTYFRARPGQTYFIRVRSDEVRSANIELATGPFFLVLDSVATDVAIDPITRRGGDTSAFDGFADPNGPPAAVPALPTPDPNIPDPGFRTKLYEFTAQGDGLAFMVVQPTGLAPVNDPALRLLDENGNLIAYNDNFNGTSAQLEVRLVGGKRYFLIVEGFAFNDGVQYAMNIEANSTIDLTPNNAFDDHQNADTDPNNNNRLTQIARDQATPLTWNAPVLQIDTDGNAVRDRGLTTTATGTGRIFDNGDTDLFSFVPQIDMLDTYGGNNDDIGTSLFIGGNFDWADSGNPAYPTISRSLVTWDAQDFWATGDQRELQFNGAPVRVGFTVNNGVSGKPEINVLKEFDPDGTGPARPVLFVGGDFTLTILTPFGPQSVNNMVVWQFDPQQQKYVWNLGLASTDGPVNAAEVFDDNTADIIPPALYIGGTFTNIGGTPANALARFRNGAFEAVGDLQAGESVFAIEIHDPADAGAALDGDEANFAGPTNFTTGTTPSRVITGDFNNDRFEDMLVTNSASNNVTIRLNDGAGGFGAATTLATGNSPIDAVIGDLDRDGNLDFITANSGGNSLSVFRGNGDGTFAAAATTALGFSPNSLAIGRLNAGSDLDLAVGTGTNVRVLLGGANATFGAPGAAIATNLIANIASIKIGDVFGNDGINDIAVAGGARVSRLEGNGDGTFAAGVFNDSSAAPLVSAGNAIDLRIEDLNNDGQFDMAVLNRVVIVGTPNRNSAFVSTFNYAGPNVAIADSEAITQNDFYGRGLALGDFDMDGKLDVAISGSYRAPAVAPDPAVSEEIVIVGKGTDFTFQFTFDDRTVLGVTAPAIGPAPARAAITATDLDNDGDTDVIVANPAANSASVLLDGETARPEGPDLATQLYIGGAFTGFTRVDEVHYEVPIQNLARVVGTRLDHPIISGNRNNLRDFDIDNTVFAIQGYQKPPVLGVDQPLELYFGGAFTTVGGVAVSRLGALTPGAENQPATYTIREETGVAVGAVFALDSWDPPEINPGGDTLPILVVGGFFPGFLLAVGDDNQLFAGTTTDGPVLAITSFIDEQEPGIQRELDGPGNPQEVLYIGGQFTTITTPAGNIAAANVAQFAANTDGNNPDDFFEWTGLGGGVQNNDPNLAAPIVLALTNFDDGIASTWDRHDRPNTRVAITLSGADGSFNNMLVRVYDSLGRLIYGPNDTIAPPFPDPAGMIDPSVSGPPLTTGQNLVGIQVWAGETYYVEVLSQGTGRYNLAVTADAASIDIDRATLSRLYQLPDGDLPLAVPTTGDGAVEDINAIVSTEETDEGNFANAAGITTTLANGDGQNDRNASQPPNAHGFSERRAQKVRPGPNVLPVFDGDRGNISTISDTDLYQFRAEFTGTVEVRLQTALIEDEFGLFRDFNEPDFEGITRPSTTGGGANGEDRIISNFDGALRVFRNDFAQVAYNNDSEVVRGDQVNEFNRPNNNGGQQGAGGEASTGTFTNTTFRPRDPRVVFNVVAGNVYFLQVESGQRYIDGSPEDPDLRIANISREIDQRYATGGYRLIVNQMARQSTDIEDGQTKVDDHTSDPNPDNDILESISAAPTAPETRRVPTNLGTMIPIGNDPTDSLTNGRGSVTGVIDNTPNLGRDSDTFQWIATGDSAAMIVRVAANPNSTIIPQLKIWDATNSVEILVTGTTDNDGSVFATIPNVLKGQQFAALVTGASNTEGAYTISVTGVPVVDDHADEGRLWAATDIDVPDFLNNATVTGNIESQGDTDVFRFSARDFGSGSITVVGLDPSLTPTVTVYEINEDASGNPVPMRIGGDRNTLATANFSFRSQRVRDNAPAGAGPEDVEFPYYYVIVDGAGTGRYNMTVNLPATDDHPDAPALTGSTVGTNEFGFASEIVLDVDGLGSLGGDVELANDSDLFKFTAPATGVGSLSYVRATGSLLRATVQITDAQGNVIASALNTDVADSGLLNITFNVTRNTTYFVVVTPFDAAPNNNTDVTGSYTLTLAVPPVDDHANQDEFTRATNIALNTVTGQGLVGPGVGIPGTNPRINYTSDTDLFSFTTIFPGVTTVLIPANALAGAITPVITIYAANTTTIIATAIGSAAGAATSITLPTAVAGTKFYVLVNAGPSGATTGEYSLQINGPTGTGGGGGGSVGAIDFNAPQVIAIDSATGDGSSLKLVGGATPDNSISVAGDRDLYSFTTGAAGRVYVQIVTPDGSLLDASVRILAAGDEGRPISVDEPFDADGIAGSTASVSFKSAANQRFFVVVDGLGDSTGSYIVRINSEAAVSRLYFPEGFTSPSVSEFVNLVNPNPWTVFYTVVLRYEDGGETRSSVRPIAQNSRDGLTISRPLGNGQFFRELDVRENTPYSIMIEWSQPGNLTPDQYGNIQTLGATLSHYDFGGSTGESFTETTASTWNFARVERDPGNVRDYVLFFNPNNFAVDVTLTWFDQFGNTGTLNRTNVGANRRDGWGIDDETTIPRGVVSVQLTSRATNNANQADFVGIVGSLTHYSLVGDQSAFTYIGDPTGGSTKGVITDLVQGNGATGQLVLFNPNNEPTTVTLDASYLRAQLPSFTRTVSIPARSQRVLNGTDLGLITGQPVGIKYSASLPISANASQVQLGDADSSNGTALAGNRFFFGDGFINKNTAGSLYFESLYIYNPANVASNINITLNFTAPDANGGRDIADGTPDFIVNVPAGGFVEVKLHERAEILNTRFATPQGQTWFGVEASAVQPFVISMSHYDLFLGGGWQAAGVPLGLPTNLNSIRA